MDYSTMGAKDLKALCVERGLDVEGMKSKTQFMQALIEVDSGNQFVNITKEAVPMEELTLEEQTIKEELVILNERNNEILRNSNYVASRILETEESTTDNLENKTANIKNLMAIQEETQTELKVNLERVALLEGQLVRVTEDKDYTANTTVRLNQEKLQIIENEISLFAEKEILEFIVEKANRYSQLLESKKDLKSNIISLCSEFKLKNNDIYAEKGNFTENDKCQIIRKLYDIKKLANRIEK
ncbi:MAG: hypothetical protein ACRC6E_08270 [Fusobacteriaceae bacterium]